MPSSSQAALDALLAACRSETPDVEVKGAEFTRGGVVFAARPRADAVELRLGPDIADAALRTPGTRPSARGTEWVILQSADWSTAEDRLEAWYRVAWRLAGKATR